MLPLQLAAAHSITYDGTWHQPPARLPDGDVLQCCFRLVEAEATQAEARIRVENWLAVDAPGASVRAELAALHKRLAAELHEAEMQVDEEGKCCTPAIRECWDRPDACPHGGCGGTGWSPHLKMHLCQGKQCRDEGLAMCKTLCSRVEECASFEFWLTREN